MSSKSLKKNRVTISQTMDTSQNKSDKRTSRFLNSIDIDNQDSNQDKAFLYFSIQSSILLDICQELVQLHNDSNRLEIETAIKNNQSYEAVAMLVHSKLQLMKKDYITNEYKFIQLKESQIQMKDPDNFHQYAKLQEQNQRWKQLFFQEARTVIEQSKQLRQNNIEIEQHIEYIRKLEEKLEIIENKYLQMFQQIHVANPNLDLNKQYVDYIQELKENLKLIQLQLTQSRTQCLSLTQRLQDEIFKTQAGQELRIVDLQYIMNLENDSNNN